ncbi:MAG: CDP-diacylglycerol--serine O-phosphatidyltransferase, partial [Chlorobi bacterium]|nr:CDP-diacylglycerol--serine O-phosphatidyltransferase [Chlorobiota bacterium]
MKKHIPNFITLLNLLSGVISIYFGFTGDLKLSALMIFVAAVFDFLDGLMARLLNAKSDIGLQLDSLADVVSFGVAPAFVLFQTIRLVNGESGEESLNYLAFTAFLIPLFAALRLAKFNIDENQATTFSGMPTPAVALYFASLPI